MSLSTILKTTAAAGLIALSVSATTTPAAARVYETQCYGGDCYRMSCSDYGYNCRRIEYLGQVGYTRYRDRWMCDAYGGNCQWVRTRNYNYDYDDDDFYGD